MRTLMNVAPDCFAMACGGRGSARCTARGTRVRQQGARTLYVNKQHTVDCFEQGEYSTNGRDKWGLQAESEGRRVQEGGG